MTNNVPFSCFCPAARRQGGTMTAVRMIAAAAAALLIAPLPIDDDGDGPTPPPTPGYQIPSPGGPTFPGTQTYPPWCARNMMPCGFNWDPATGTSKPRGTE